MPINSLVQGGGRRDLRLLHLAEDHRVLARELLDVVLRELLRRRADVRLAALLGLEEDLFRLLDLDVLDDVQERLADVLLRVFLVAQQDDVEHFGVLEVLDVLALELALALAVVRAAAAGIRRRLERDLLLELDLAGRDAGDGAAQGHGPRGPHAEGRRADECEDCCRPAHFYSFVDYSRRAQARATMLPEPATRVIWPPRMFAKLWGKE